MATPPFRFKKFSIQQEDVVHPVGTDGVLLGAWASVAGAQTILDIGTGTGIIALMAAQRNENALITGLEPDAATVQTAVRNCQASPWRDRLTIVPSTVQQYVQEFPEARYDCILSNPPFFSETTTAPDARRRQGRHQSALRLGVLTEMLVQLLSPTGRCCLILPPLEAQRLSEMAATRRLYVNRHTAVHTRPGKPVERTLLQLSFDPYGYQRAVITILTENGDYADDFKKLTQDFYL